MPWKVSYLPLSTDGTKIAFKSFCKTKRRGDGGRQRADFSFPGKGLVPSVKSAVADLQLSQSLKTDQTVPFLNRPHQKTRDPISTVKFLIHVIDVTHQTVKFRSA